MRCVFEVCCARAATGHVVKTVIPLMKSRRRIACPEAQDRASYRLKPTLGTAPLMSALGQRQTLCSAAVESAPGALAVTGNVDYGVDDDTGRDGDQVRYQVEVDA